MISSKLSHLRRGPHSACDRCHLTQDTRVTEAGPLALGVQATQTGYLERSQRPLTLHHPTPQAPCQQPRPTYQSHESPSWKVHSYSGQCWALYLADSRTVPAGLWGRGTAVPILQRRLGEGTDRAEQSWPRWESHCFGLATWPGWPHTWAGPWPVANQRPQGVAGHKLQKAQTTQPRGAPGDRLLVSHGR